MNLILLGAPGAGKGTQASALSAALGIPTISTGNILKAAIRDETPMGLRAKEFIDKGELVPDDVVIGIVGDRLRQDDCKDGFILDGFPRTIPQAEALDRMDVRIDRVVEIDVPDDKIAARMSGRRVCSKCGESYHLLYKKPAEDGVCDACGGELVLRSDDRPETVLSRLGVYHTQTEPLKEYYSAKGLLVTVDGQGEINAITASILNALKG